MLKTLKTRKAASDDADAEAPAPAAPEDLGYVDLLDPDIGRDERDRDGEVDEVEDVVLQVEHRDAEVRHQERDGADEGEPGEMPDGLAGSPAAPDACRRT